jgi:hypothetical protein
MKSLFLTSVGALFLATGTAHAQSVDLPNEMLGEWCWDKIVNTQKEDDDDQTYYFREEKAQTCDDVFVLTKTTANFTRPVSSMPPLNCEIDNIEFVDQTTYRIRAHCVQHWKFTNAPDKIKRSYEYFEIRIVEGDLIKTDVSEG